MTLNHDMICEFRGYTELKKEKIGNGWYVLHQNDNGEFVVTHKGQKGAYKKGCIFSSQDSALMYIDGKRTMNNNKELRKAKRKAEQNKEIEKIKVGDVFVANWGYEANNVNFYKILGIKGTRLIMREMVQVCVKAENESWDYTGHYFPKDEFVGEEFSRKFNGYGVKINSYMYAGLWNGKPVRTYNAH